MADEEIWKPKPRVPRQEDMVKHNPTRVTIDRYDDPYNCMKCRDIQELCKLHVDIAKDEERKLEKLLKVMRKPMLEAMERKAQFEAVGIRADIYHDFDTKTGKYSITVTPNKVDVALYNKRIEEAIKNEF